LLCCSLAYAEEPATQPTETESLVIDASDKAALDAAMNKEVVVEGVVETAAWSSSGKVMQIRFKDTQESKFLAVVFERKKADFDSAYSGDITKALPGAKVRLRGTIKDFKGKPEIVLDVPAQITIVEPPTTTQPAN
jgi:DNA/RNA endonuclease YhcR with UshA esterase domain